jgi:hypothetical protein
MALSTREQNVFQDVAASLRVQDPRWLIDLVRFESGFDPQAKNPWSSARGLIQFIDSTARGMGYKDSLDLVTRHPTVESQLKGPVQDYLSPYSPFNDEYQLYMAVFFPAARKYPPNTPFKEIFKKIYASAWESKYADFKKANPSIETPADYVSYVKKKPIIRVATKGGIGIAAVGAAYLLWRLLKA